MKKTVPARLGMTLAGALALIATSALADTFGTTGNEFTIDFVPIGNAGNADDAGAGGGLYSSPYGGVGYEYRMGKFEISQDAITKATASGLQNVTAGAWTGNRPAADITWFQAAAFVNWLNTSTGHQEAYQLFGLTLTPWDSGDAWQLGGENLFRHKNAYYFLPSEDEWYKAAYHQNTGVNADYWDYATGSNTIPTAVVDGTGAGTAVYNHGMTGSPAAVNNVGGESAYGTMGQNGNVWEFLETAYDGTNDSPSEGRTLRGGDYFLPESYLRSSERLNSSPASATYDVGFRVASVPEPSSAMLIIGSGFMWMARRRRSLSR